jgi:hypothetical protein
MCLVGHREKRRSARASRADLRTVHRGVRHKRPQSCEIADRRFVSDGSSEPSPLNDRRPVAAAAVYEISTSSDLSKPLTPAAPTTVPPMRIGAPPCICSKIIGTSPQATQKRFKRVSSIWVTSSTSKPACFSAPARKPHYVGFCGIHLPLWERRGFEVNQLAEASWVRRLAPRFYRVADWRQRRHVCGSSR